MPSTRSSSSTSFESVASRVKRFARPAAVDARRRLEEMTAVAYPEDSFVQTESQAPSMSVRPAVAQHRYMLRSMRR